MVQKPQTPNHTNALYPVSKQNKNLQRRSTRRLFLRRARSTSVCRLYLRRATKLRSSQSLRVVCIRHCSFQTLSYRCNFFRKRRQDKMLNVLLQNCLWYTLIYYLHAMVFKLTLCLLLTGQVELVKHGQLFIDLLKKAIIKRQSGSTVVSNHKLERTASVAEQLELSFKQ